MKYNVRIILLILVSPVLLFLLMLIMNNLVIDALGIDLVAWREFQSRFISSLIFGVPGAALCAFLRASTAIKILFAAMFYVATTIIAQLFLIYNSCCL